MRENVLRCGGGGDAMLHCGKPLLGEVLAWISCLQESLDLLVRGQSQLKKPYG